MWTSCHRILNCIATTCNAHANQDVYKQVGILSPLIIQGHSIDDDKCKAELLNECFVKNFTVPESPIDINRYSALGGENYPVDLFCTEEEVFDLICGIDPTKSSGSDQISARMLRTTVTSITPAVTKLFNISIKTGELPTD